ncbi:MAG: hypothetical protein Q7R41_18890 [Phycisphaerales bacterium]|nr:hypothetical protein [Phycisphaerales bacterium]
MITGHGGRRSLYDSRSEWHRVFGMCELRDLRRAANLRQREFAALLSIPLETFRPWDSGRRVVSAAVLQRARDAVVHHRRQHELLPLDQLAKELHVHLRTLQAAARTGRLDAHFSVRSAFGRPIRFASRAAGDQFLARHYRCFSGQEVCPLPLRTVPDDYDTRLRKLRRRMRLTQDALARRIGAAGKAVVYQWESRKRTPSPVLWERVEALGRIRLNPRRVPMSSQTSAKPVSVAPQWTLNDQDAADRYTLRDISGTIEYRVVRTPLSRPGVRVRKIAPRIGVGATERHREEPLLGVLEPVDIDP